VYWVCLYALTVVLADVVVGWQCMRLTTKGGGALGNAEDEFQEHVSDFFNTAKVRTDEKRGSNSDDSSLSL
jgi:hypothetical protein